MGTFLKDPAAIFLAAICALWGIWDRASSVNVAAPCTDARGRRVKIFFLCFQLVEDFRGSSGTYTVETRCSQLALCLGSSPWNLEIIWLGFDTLVLSFQLTSYGSLPGFIQLNHHQIEISTPRKISGRSYSILTAFISYDLYVGHLVVFLFCSILPTASHG